MAGNRRRLTIEIEGENDGFDRAARQSQARASAFDQTLQDLERSEREAREEAERNAAALQRLERAQQQARQAAERLARGEISAAEAAQLQADANQQLQRVLMATAAASRAAAAAADELAEEQREAARAAEIAAGRQRLAQLRAAGATREHDRLLQQMRQRFGDLGKDGDKAFSRMGKSASAAGAAMVSPQGGLAKIAIALGLLPWAASLAGAALTLGLGGALIGLGLKAAMGSKAVKKELDGLKKHIKTESKDIGKPFERTWHVIAQAARDTFDELIPDLRAALAQLAPEASAFADDFIRSFSKFGPTIDDVADAVGPLLRALGGEMPTLMGRIADSISRIAESADPAMLVRMVDTLGALIVGASYAISALTKLADVFLRFGPLAIAARNIGKVGDSLRKVAGDGVSVKDAIADAEAQMVSFDLGASAAASATVLMASGMSGASGQVGTLGATMKLASQTAEQLKASLDKLAGKTLNLRQATSAYQAAIDDATASVEQNGRAHKFNTAAGRANNAALNTLATTAHAQAVAMRDSGKSAQKVTTYMEGARKKFVSTAQQMGYTRRQAEALATKLFGVRNAANSIPKKKHIPITASTGQARAAINALIAEMSARTINIGVNLLGGGLGHAQGGYIGYAKGGPVKGYPSGGLVRGPGSATSDSIPARLSNGEYVINASATSKYRPLLEAINSRQRTASLPMSRPAGGSGGGGGGGGILHVSLSIGDKPLGELLINPLRKSIQTRGGSVQAALGVAGRG